MRISFRCKALGAPSTPPTPDALGRTLSGAQHEPAVHQAVPEMSTASWVIVLLAALAALTATTFAAARLAGFPVGSLAPRRNPPPRRNAAPHHTPAPLWA